MTTMNTELIPGPWTYADLADLPEDGKRYEIIDGVLIVNASPRPRHQAVLAHELRDGRYEVVADVVGDEMWTAALPFPVMIVPARLLD